MIDLSVFTNLANIDLGALSDKPTALTPGQKEGATSLWVSPDGKLDIGVWECTPGRFTADRSASSEFCYFLSGKVIMIKLDGERYELGQGDAIMLPLGWKGEWEVVEHVRKIYVLQS